jgi:mRNA interferase RelE/StbE
MYKVTFHDKTKKDLSGVNKNELLVIKRVITEKLKKNPLLFGKNLRESLKNHRSIRVGKFRIIYKIVSKQIHILATGL